MLCNKLLVVNTKYDYPLIITVGNYFTLFYVSCFVVSYKYSSVVDLNFFLTPRIIILSILTGVDQALSNLSHRHLSLGVYTIIKSIVPLFIMIIGFFLRIEKVSVLLILSILLICSGVAITSIRSLGEPSDFLGVLMILISAVCQSVRFIYSQMLLQKKDRIKSSTSDPEELNSILLVFYTTPISLIVVLFGALLDDVPQLLKAICSYEEEWYFQLIIIMAGLSVCTTLLVFSQFYVIQTTSSLTLTVSSKVRSLFIVIISIFLLKDADVFLIAGWLVVIVGLVLYYFQRWRSSLRGDNIVPITTYVDEKKLIKNLVHSSGSVESEDTV